MSHTKAAQRQPEISNYEDDVLSWPATLEIVHLQEDELLKETAAAALRAEEERAEWLVLAWKGLCMIR